MPFILRVWGNERVHKKPTYLHVNGNQVKCENKAGFHICKMDLL